MRLIEPDELQQFSDILKSRACSIEDFELSEVDVTDPLSDELLPLKGFVEIRRKSSHTAREYPTGDGSCWVADFERDLACGHFG